jgi:predicted NUDIX family NTP pyrophosphohydrolase
MAARSAGILLFRHGPAGPEVLLVHPGGPFWARKDLGAWSIPKGELADGEEPLACARREFAEETGIAPPAGEYVPLGEVRQRGGKHVEAWAAEGDLDPDSIVSGTFELQWPPRSVRIQEFP